MNTSILADKYNVLRKKCTTFTHGLLIQIIIETLKDVTVLEIVRNEANGNDETVQTDYYYT